MYFVYGHLQTFCSLLHTFCWDLCSFCFPSIVILLKKTNKQTNILHSFLVVLRVYCTNILCTFCKHCKNFFFNFSLTFSTVINFCKCRLNFTRKTLGFYGHFMRCSLAKSGQNCRHIILWVYKMSVRVHVYRHCNLQLSTGTSSFL